MRLDLKIKISERKPSTRNRDFEGEGISTLEPGFQSRRQSPSEPGFRRGFEIRYPSSGPDTNNSGTMFRRGKHSDFGTAGPKSNAFITSTMFRMRGFKGGDRIAISLAVGRVCGIRGSPVFNPGWLRFSRAGLFSSRTTEIVVALTVRLGSRLQKGDPHSGSG